MTQLVGWVERSDTHHLSMRAQQGDGFRKGSTHPTDSNEVAVSIFAFVRSLVAYLSAGVSLYWAWRFFAIVTPRLLTEDANLQGVYGHVGFVSWLIWAVCSCGCYFCAGAIENSSIRLAVVGIVGGTWGAILFVNLYYGWVGYDRYPGRILW